MENNFFFEGFEPFLTILRGVCAFVMDLQIYGLVGETFLLRFYVTICNFYAAVRK